MTAPPPPARKYQQVGTDWLARQGRALLADDPGLGKSRQLLEAARGRTLVVAPARVLDGGVWTDEIAKWAPGADVTQVAYTGLSAYERIGKGSRPSGRLKPEYAGRFDTLILDEAHYIKGRGTVRTGLIRQLANRCDRVYLATGTPIPNWPHELFTLLQVIDPAGCALGGRLGSYWRWVGEWFRVEPSRWDPHARQIGRLKACQERCAARPADDPCEHYFEFMRANLGGRFLQRRRDDVLTDLPPLTEVRVECPMVPAQAKAYRAMKKDYAAAVGDSGDLLVAWSAGARNVLLDRLTTGLGVASGGCGGEASGKLDRLAYDLANRATPTLVVAHYRDTVEAAGKVAVALGASVGCVHGGTSRKARGEAVRGFQAGRLDVLVGSLETISEGLTLTRADLCIFVEKSYKPSRNEQAMRRVHRIGQTRPVTVLDYVTPRTVDAAKRELLASKTDAQMRALTAGRFLAMLNG